MKVISLFLSICLSLPNAFAAGSTEVDVSKVNSIEVHDDVIRIRADAKYRTRIVSDMEHGDAQVWGEPAQWIHGSIQDGIFEIRSYEEHFAVAEGTELAREFKKQWDETKDKARHVQAGDSMVIIFQGEETLIKGFRIVKVTGPGSIHPKAESGPRD